MPLVNSPLAIVGCPHKYHEEDILKGCCGVPTSPRAEPRADLRDPESEQWPGIALLFLASSWLLWARAQLWLNHFILVICPGIVTPAPILLESFLTEPHFGFLVPFQFYAPRKPNQPRSFPCIDCLPALLLLHFHLEIWENLGYSWTCFYLHRWY